MEDWHYQIFLQYYWASNIHKVIYWATHFYQGTCPLWVKMDLVIQCLCYQCFVHHCLSTKEVVQFLAIYSRVYCKLRIWCEF